MEVKNLEISLTPRETLELMHKAGMPTYTPLYFGGHSLGTVFLQVPPLTHYIWSKKLW